jgi:hypothetical protein
LRDSESALSTAPAVTVEIASDLTCRRSVALVARKLLSVSAAARAKSSLSMRAAKSSSLSVWDWWRLCRW